MNNEQLLYYTLPSSSYRAINILHPESISLRSHEESSLRRRDFRQQSLLHGIAQAGCAAGRERGNARVYAWRVIYRLYRAESPRFGGAAAGDGFPGSDD